MSPKRYRLIIEGELGPRYASAFDGMTSHAQNGTTEITGPIIDSSRASRGCWNGSPASD